MTIHARQGGIPCSLAAEPEACSYARGLLPLTGASGSTKSPTVIATSTSLETSFSTTELRTLTAVTATTRPATSVITSAEVIDGQTSAALYTVTGQTVQTVAFTSVLTAPPDSPTTSDTSSAGGNPAQTLSTGAVAGLAVSVTAVFFLCIAVAWFLVRRRRRARVTAGEIVQAVGIEKDGTPVAELQGTSKPQISRHELLVDPAELEGDQPDSRMLKSRPPN